MAIQLEFINFIVPREVIEKKYPGGWGKCLADHATLIGGRVWYDDHLFRDGAMNPMDIESLVESWKARGFHTHDGKEHPTKWVDVCVAEALFGGSTLPCDWLQVEGNVAFHNDFPKGDVTGREHFYTDLED